MRIKQELKNKAFIMTAWNKATKYNYMLQFKLFLQFIKKPSISVTKEDIFEYWQYIQKYKENTRLLKISILKSIYNYLIKAGQTSINPVKELENNIGKKLKAIKHQEEKIIPSSKEIERAIKADYKTGCFIRFFIFSGIRVSELTGIELKNIRKEKKYYAINVLGKGNKKRTIMQPIAFIDELKTYFKGKKYLFETKSGNKYNRENITVFIKKAFKGKYNSHCLRHYFITSKLNDKMPLPAVSRYVGHSNVNTTMRYSHNKLSYEDLF
jgi:integrase/recombinase XerC